MLKWVDWYFPLGPRKPADLQTTNMSRFLSIKCLVKNNMFKRDIKTATGQIRSIQKYIC
jgi:hypothetical protein